MRASRVLLAGVAAFLVSGLAVLRGAPEEGKPEPEPQPQRIAFLDMDRVIAGNQGLKAAKKETQKEVARAEAGIKKEQEEIAAAQRALDAVKRGSREREEGERRIAERIANLNVNLALQRSKFKQREGADHYKAYQEIDAEVRAYVKANHLTAVFRFDTSPGESADPDSVIRVLNRPVIYWEDAMDITPAILERMEPEAD